MEYQQLSQNCLKNVATLCQSGKIFKTSKLEKSRGKRMYIICYLFWENKNNFLLRALIDIDRLWKDL